MPHADPFTSVLLKLFSQTKKILSNAASDTMFAVITSLELPKLIPSVCATLLDKNKDGRTLLAPFFLWKSPSSIDLVCITVRVKGSEVMKKMLESWSADTLSKGEVGFEKVLKIGVVDATPAVRENSRASFWLYCALFPNRAPMSVNPPSAFHFSLGVDIFHLDTS